MSTLRQATIRLAYEHPELQPILLPLLKQGKKSEEDEDEDEKESKFEEGEDVPLSELPEELQENVKDPPPAAKALKKVLKKKGEYDLWMAAAKLAQQDRELRPHLMPALKAAASEIPTPPNPSNDRANEMGWDPGQTAMAQGDGKEAALLRETIKLAAEKPELRERLLPSIREAMMLPLLGDELAMFSGTKEAADKWKKLPKGWTDESRKKFWDSLTGDVEHKVTKCIKKMEGKVDDAGAFCAALKDRVSGTTKWRGEDEKKKAAEGKLASDEWLSLDEVRELCPSCADKMANYNLTSIKASTLRLAIKQVEAQNANG